MSVSIRGPGLRSSFAPDHLRAVSASLAHAAYVLPIQKLLPIRFKSQAEAKMAIFDWLEGYAAGLLTSPNVHLLLHDESVPRYLRQDPRQTSLALRQLRTRFPAKDCAAPAPEATWQFGQDRPQRPIAPASIRGDGEPV